MARITELVRSLFRKARDEEPAVALGIAGTFLLEVQDVVLNEHVVSWRTAVPVIIGFVVRRYVYSPKGAADAAAEAVVREFQVPDDPSALDR